MYVLLLQLVMLAYGYPILENGQLLIGAGGLACEKDTITHIKFLNVYKAYVPQVIFVLSNYTNEMQFSDFALDIHVELMKVNTTGFTIQVVCSKSCIKSVLYTWYAFGGDTYDSGCFPLQEKAQVTLEQIYTSPMQHSVFISGFAGFFKYGGRKPMLKLYSSFDNQNLTIQAESTFQYVYICYILAQDMSSTTLNDTEIATLVQKGTYQDDTLIMGMESFQLFGNNLQIQMLNDKSFFPKQIELTVKVAKLYDPTYRSCPKVYTECMFQGDPIYVCDETVKLTNIWKEFKSLRVYDQKMKFKLNIVSNDNILWLSEDIDCSYDMYDQLMEFKIKNQPIERQIIRKRKMLGMLYDEQTEEDQEDSEDTILIGQA
ncbi:unnamed protein product [Paramecium octaurelia]|uniref:H-type lectin domain-containing protein n=1 Tax=Paramecium octaurelia TaxID=43137 RepID=A0A8S1VU85_PAROT|nr:unnamed protein product [Paramecium octaurelia]